MKIRCIQLMTTFMAIIGLNVAVLVGYIFIYSQFIGEFPQVGKKLSSDIIIAQAENSPKILTIDTQSTFPDNTVQPNSITETVDCDTSGNRTAYSYDPVKQQLFEELPTQKEQLSQEQQHFTPTQNAQNNFYSDSGTSDTVSNTNNMPEVTSANNSNTGSPSHSGNNDNFNAYNNPHLQLTTDKYVLNTYSQIFHIPDCNDVAKMAEKNYATSNSSYGDIVSLGYRPCGHCLKNYSGDLFSSSSSFDNADYSDISDLSESSVDSQIPTDTYIINKETKYFHVPNSNCKYLNWTEPQNSETTHKSSDELRKEGYLPCRFCGL